MDVIEILCCPEYGNNNNTNTYKPGPGFPLDIDMKIKSIFQELRTENNLEMSPWQNSKLKQKFQCNDMGTITEK